MKTQINELTDAGKKNNEDAYFSTIEDGRIFAIIADGITSLDAGERASNFVVESFKNWLKTRYSSSFSKITLMEELELLAQEIHDNLLSIGEDEGIKLGSTLSAVILAKKKLIYMQIGDSRIYVKQNNNLKKITIDQTVQNYEKLTGQRINSVSSEKKEHTLLRCLGRGELYAYVGEEEVSEDVEILICSDGLTNSISEYMLYKELEKHKDGSKCLSSLVEIARSNEEEDNITGLLIRRRKS